MGNDIRDHRIDAQPITNTSSEEMTKWDENVDKAILRQFGFWIFEIQNLNAGIFFVSTVVKKQCLAVLDKVFWNTSLQTLQKVSSPSRVRAV